MTNEQEPPNIELQDDDLTKRYGGMVPPRQPKLGCLALLLILVMLSFFVGSAAAFWSLGVVPGGVLAGCGLLALIALSLSK